MQFLLESVLNFQCENIVSSFHDIHKALGNAFHSAFACYTDRTPLHESSPENLHDTHPQRMRRSHIHGLWTKY